MKSSLLFSSVLLVVSAASENLLPNINYHEAVGISRFAALKQYEEGVDFDGGRIWGGQAVGAGAQPHLGGLIIALEDGRTSVCGSSLLSNTRSVTAAHCWSSPYMDVTHFTIVWGSNRLMTGGTRTVTNQVVIHPDYQPFELHSDVAIIRHNHVNFNELINRVHLPVGTDTYAGVWAVAAGFGRTGDMFEPPVANPEKRQANLLVITNDMCRQHWGNLVDSMLCVSTAHGGSPCPGDSGGPLTIGSGNNRILIGVTSFGDVVWCSRHTPTGFARVTTFAHWIRGQL